MFSMIGRELPISVTMPAATPHSVLGALAVRMGLIDQETLDRLIVGLGDSPTEAAIGHALVHSGHVPVVRMQQLEIMAAEMAHDGPTQSETAARVSTPTGGYLATRLPQPERVGAGAFMGKTRDPGIASPKPQAGFMTEAMPDFSSSGVIAPPWRSLASAPGGGSDADQDPTLRLDAADLAPLGGGFDPSATLINANLADDEEPILLTSVQPPDPADTDGNSAAANLAELGALLDCADVTISRGPKPPLPPPPPLVSAGPAPFDETQLNLQTPSADVREHSMLSALNTASNEDPTLAGVDAFSIDCNDAGPLRADALLSPEAMAGQLASPIGGASGVSQQFMPMSIEPAPTAPQMRVVSAATLDPPPMPRSYGAPPMIPQPVLHHNGMLPPHALVQMPQAMPQGYGPPPAYLGAGMPAALGMMPGGGVVMMAPAAAYAVNHGAMHGVVAPMTPMGVPLVQTMNAAPQMGYRVDNLPMLPAGDPRGGAPYLAHPTARQHPIVHAQVGLHAVQPAPMQEHFVRPPAPPPEASMPPRAVSEVDSLRLSMHEPDAEDTAQLHAILEAAVDRHASDIHVHSGATLKVRTHGELVALSSDVFDRDRVARMISSVLDEGQQAELSKRGEIDLCYELEGVARFRTNIYRQQNGMDAVFRAIPAHPPTFEELGLPDKFESLVEHNQGMVLCTGPKGAGKSSTMAAFVNLINERRDDHILTIEDPIEYKHPSKRCLVNQRHVGPHTDSFARALRGALREDPDVIVIGELRDLESISLALTAAETGHFVLATMHTGNAIRTINRVVGAFPSGEQDQVRSMISESLRGITSQRLLPKADGDGRVVAYEILLVTKAVANLIRENKIIQIRSAMQTGVAMGMCLLDQCLEDLVSEGAITARVAMRCAEDKSKFLAMIGDDDDA